MSWSFLIILLLGQVSDVRNVQAISASGTTTLDAKLAKKHVIITLQTVRLDRTNPLFPTDDIWDAKEITVVRGLRIAVDGRDVFVPRAVFTSWIDPRTLSVRSDKSGMVLRVEGGDASTSYFVLVQFDADHVKSQILYSSITPEKATQETKYRVLTLKEKP